MPNSQFSKHTPPFGHPSLAAEFHCSRGEFRENNSQFSISASLKKAHFQSSTKSADILILNSQLIIVFSLLLISCSQNFTNTHKMYNGVPAKTESVGFVKLGEAFMLTRANWFAEKLSMNGDSIYKDLEIFSDSIIFSELSKQWNLSVVPANKRESFSKETLKMDKTIFIKTRLPEQGVEVASDNGTVPNYLFIIHEYTVGGDFEAESFYDYTKANLEMTQRKKVQNLSIIATWTLWDNKKQIPLKSGIASSQTPLKNDSLNIDTFTKATKQAVKLCLKKL